MDNRNFYLSEEEIDAIIELFIDGLLEYSQNERRFFLKEMDPWFSRGFLKQINNDPLDQLKSDLLYLNNKRYRTSDNKIPFKSWLKFAENKLQPIQQNVNFNDLIEKISVFETANSKVNENHSSGGVIEKIKEVFSRYIDKQAIVFLCVGLSAVISLIFLKVFFDRTDLGKTANIKMYEYLRSVPLNSANNELPVIVLDISDLKLSPNGAVPPDKLKDIVGQLFESGAKAVAINIKFTPRIDHFNPDDTGLRHEDDFDFFDYLIEQRNKGNQVFLGVNQFDAEPETWLGMPEYKDLAADLTICEGEQCSDTEEIPMWLKCENYPKLYSIGKALANVSEDNPQPPNWLKPLLKDYEDEKNLVNTWLPNRNGDKITCQKALMPINYTNLEQIEDTSIQAFTKESILQANTKFRNKLVIIGKTQRGKTTALYDVKGKDDVVPGVFIPAMAAYTLVADPIYKLKPWVSIFIDGFAGAIMVFGLFIFRFRKRYEIESNLRAELIFLLTFIALILVSGFLAVKFYNLFWLDFWLVIFAPFLYSAFTNKLFKFLQIGE